jgi:probable rRNA maturation factor
MRKILLMAMRLMGQKKESEVSLLLTGDQEIQKLNSLYRGINAPTDVLAFSLVEGQDNFSLLDGMDEYLLGDIVISIETAQRQARNFGHSLQHEITVLLIHGLLHLLGFDHMREEDTEKMQFLERKILYHIRKENE